MDGNGNGNGNERRLAQHRQFLFPVLVAVICFLGFAGLTIGFTAWALNNSEHKWCQVITLLNEAPSPEPSPDSPSRIYDAKLAEDFHILQRSLGCS